MAIEKALYEAPQGLAAIDQPPVEIEIHDPEAVDINAGDMEIHMEKDHVEDDFGRNLAEDMNEGLLAQIAEIGRAHV